MKLEVRLVTAILAGIATAGCVGEAAIGFKGSVTAADAASSGYEAARVVEAPIAGATLVACHCTQQPCVCAPDSTLRATSDASGAYEIHEIVFGGFVGVKDYFTVTASAPGYEPNSFTLDYGKGYDLARAQFLDFKMKKAARASGGLRFDEVLARELRLAEAPVGPRLFVP